MQIIIVINNKLKRGRGETLTVTWEGGGAEGVTEAARQPVELRGGDTILQRGRGGCYRDVCITDKGADQTI